MDGASKFVRGDAIAGLIIIAVNIFGGIIIGVTRHGMSLGDAADVFTKLSVGDGLVTQIPALIVSLAAGLLVSKGGTRGSAEKAVLGQLGNYPRALLLAALLMFVLALVARPALPALRAARRHAGLRRLFDSDAARGEAQAAEEAKAREAQRAGRGRGAPVGQGIAEDGRDRALPRQAARARSSCARTTSWRSASRKMRRKFAQQYGFVVPGDQAHRRPRRSRRRAIRSRSTARSSPAQELRIGDVLVITGDGPRPDVPGDEAREPAFGMKAMWISEMFADEVKREGFTPVDNMSVLLTHLSEVIRNNLAQLLSYKDMRALLDRLEPEYKRLIDEICPSQISYSGLQAVLKLLLAERISIRNLHLILEAIAEIAPHVRRAEQLAEHVRMRMAQQICGDLAEGGVLKVLRLGNRWDLAFHQSLKRDAKGDVVEFDIDPRLIEQFGDGSLQGRSARTWTRATSSCW